MIELSYAILAKLGANILAGAAKKIVETVKKFLFKPKAKAVLKRAFQEFKKNANALDEGKGTKDKNILLEIFEEFFKDDRVIREFQFISDAQGEKINLELLEKIFAGICSDKGIDSPTFIYFSQAISYVKKEIERVAPKWDKFKEMFQFFENRFEYLDKLQGEHKRLFFAGIPDLKEKKEIQLPAIFVMPR
ncbi:MAG: hypothetical protein QG657_5676, partial [Acidobacteriota bacterium]|nr:hypothetical protein [Acidobacteriota bacterium]